MTLSKKIANANLPTVKITDIQQQQNNPGRYSIFVDGKYQLSLLLQDIDEQAVRIGVELDNVRLRQLKQLSDDSKLYERALKKALRRPHSVVEIERYLDSKHASPELVAACTEKLIALGYLDDADFARGWHASRSRSGKSQRSIRAELLAKGVAKEIIDQVVVGDDTDALQQLLRKKAHMYDDRQKLIMFLQRRGFAYHDIKNALSLIEG